MNTPLLSGHIKPVYWLVLFLLFAAPANAQTADSLTITLTTGQQVKIALDDIDAITFETIQSSVDRKDEKATELSVYPNPAISDVNISLTLDAPQRVKLEITREDGAVIRTIEQHCDKGASTIRWNGLQDDGSLAPASTCFFRAILREKTLTGKLTLRR